jgi:hypothetical protein
MRAKVAWAAVALLVIPVACGGGGQDLPWDDDFESTGIWQAESDAAAQVQVVDGVLKINIVTANQLAWASAGQVLRDFHLTVEASQVAGPDDNEYGVLTRMQDSDNFYRFSISGDGYYMVSKYVDGQQQLLGSNWTPSQAIHQGQATNTLEVICQGSTLTFLVNGQLLADVEDSQFSRGDVGLYAGTFYEVGVEIQFDNLALAEP